MPDYSTISELLAAGDDSSVAIAAPGGVKPMTYGQPSQPRWRADPDAQRV